MMNKYGQPFEHTPLLDAFLNASIDAVFIADAQSGVIVGANSKAQTLLGYSEKEIVGMHQSDLHPENERDFYARLFQEDVRRGMSVNRSIWAKRKDGTCIPIDISAKTFNLGNKQYLVGFFRDISRIRQTEESLAQSTARFEFFFNRASDGFSLYHPSPEGMPGRFFEANETICNMLGYAKHEYLQLSPLEVIDPRDLELIPGIVEQLKSTGRAFFSLRLRKRDGATIWVEVNDHLFPYDGKSTVLSVVRDISARREMEEKLRATQAFNNNLLDNSPIPIICIKANTEILYVNQALERLTGFSFAELKGLKPPYPFWLRDRIDKIANDFRMVMEKGVTAFEEPFQKKNGDYFWVEITSLAFFDNGKFDYYLANWVDVTERKESEQRLKEMQAKLIQADKIAALGLLVAGIVHEVNNSLNFIAGALPSLSRNIETLKEALGPAQGTAEQLGNRKLSPHLFEENALLLANMKEGAERAAKIVADLRTFSVREDEEHVMTNVHAVLDSTLSLLHLQYKDRIRIIKDYGADKAEVHCPPNNLAQLFMNILLNSVQAIPDQGTISISSRNKDQAVIVAIKDSGCGIPPEIHHRIFEPFFTTKDVGQGTGLGLSISYGIVEKLGGEIQVLSVEGKGAEFILTLPRKAFSSSVLH
jgi:PAS domain S-box-containing protein